MVHKVERGAGKGPNVEFGAGVDEECRRRASAEGEEDLVCNVVVANVTKGTVAMSLGTRVYRISDLRAVLFDENENDHPHRWEESSYRCCSTKVERVTTRGWRGTRRTRAGRAAVFPARLAV